MTSSKSVLPLTELVSGRQMVERLVLGTAQLGMNYGINNAQGRPSFEDGIDVLCSAYVAGIRVIDTAEAYGQALDLIGTYHRENPTFRVISKFQIDDPKISILKKLEQTLEKLNVESLYCYQFHHFEDYLKFPTVRKDLESSRREKLIERIGVSIYSNQEFRSAAESDMIDVIQLPFNLLDNANKRGELIDLAKRRNKELHARSVFLQGLFFKDFQHFPPKLAPLVCYIKQLYDIAVDNKQDMLSLALNYVVQNAKMDHVLIGVDTVEQLSQNVKALHPAFDADLVKRIDAIEVVETDLLDPSNWNLEA